MADSSTPVPFTQRLRPWHWVALDALAALLFLVPMGGRGNGYQNPWLSLLVLVISVVFLLRRRYPLTVFLLLTAATTTLAASPSPYSSYQPFAMMLGLYSVAVARDRRVTAAATVGILALAVAIMIKLRMSPSLSLVSGAAVALLPAMTGYSVRQQRAHQAAIADEQARKVEAEVTSRLVEERLGIARELHDVVAHALSLITVQAGVAVFREHEATRMRQTLAGIEETGRAAMADMRQLLGVLRAPGSDSPSDSGQGPALSPIATSVDLGTLITQTAHAGLHISLKEEGERRPLPMAVEVAIYRIVQESLTNILRHARTTVGSVLLRFEADAVSVTVSNPAPPDGLPPKPVSPPGHGLAGMAERAALFDGTFSAGPAGGGFAVTASFPA